MEYFFYVFLGALFVDLIPFFGPPAWTIIVFLQVRYNLDIWPTLVIGVTGSAIGRYIYSLYIPFNLAFVGPPTLLEISLITLRNSFLTSLFSFPVAKKVTRFNKLS